MRILDKNEIQDMPTESWERMAYEDFKKIIVNKKRAFPCTLGVAGFAANQLRFGFITNNINSIEAYKNIAAMLQSFIPCARSFGKNTSLVVFFNEVTDFGIENYEEIFWNILNSISSYDTCEWPINTPNNPNDSLWEFSFAGEPIFVVCNTPSHKVRRSRFSKNFMITFQPRWVFEGVIGNGAPNSEKIKSEIRRRLSLFDEIPPSPDLGAYGSNHNHEWKQYFLQDTNESRNKKCPFHYKIITNQPEVVSTNIKNMEEVVTELLPPTGSVEVQYDTPLRVHEHHHHPVDETLHIIHGEITFEIGGTSVTCTSGDRLFLPAMTPHRSKAGKDGCLYAIASRIVRPELIKKGYEHAK
jgi:FPC/CPF motif-containing protein YcgG